MGGAQRRGVGLSVLAGMHERARVGPSQVVCSSGLPRYGWVLGSRTTLYAGKQRT